MKKILTAAALLLWLTPAAKAARVDIASATLSGGWTQSGTTVTWTQGSVSSSHSFTATGREILLMKNTGGSAGTVTVLSVADDRGRTGDFTHSVDGSSSTVMSQMFPTTGWRQTDGKINVNVSTTTIYLQVIRIP